MAIEQSTTTTETQRGVVINRQDSMDEEIDFKFNIPREVASTTTESKCTLNMVTLRVTNEISLLLHRNFNQQEFRGERLGSWWYSVLKNHQYSGIAMQINKKMTILYDDGLEPDQKIENKIELIAGLFFTKIDCKRKDQQITIVADDFEKYLSADCMDSAFGSFGAYSEDGRGHMIRFDDINQIPKQKCTTKKEFEYIDMIDVAARKRKMPEDLKVSEWEIADTFIYISDICTDNDYRRNGIATAMFLKLFSLYDHRGTRFGLHVRFDNEAAHHFYHQLGFRKVGDVEDYFAKDINAWKMVLVL